jgi:putative hydrolases of HD superfamily
MALVHDLAESIVGDITPHDNVTKEEKRNMEEKAFKLIIEKLP